jgi:hypothetical protein
MPRKSSVDVTRNDPSATHTAAADTKALNHHWVRLQPCRMADIGGSENSLCLGSLGKNFTKRAVQEYTVDIQKANKSPTVFFG